MFSLGFKSARLFGRNLTVWDFFLKVTYDFNQSQASSPMTSTNHRQGHIWLQPITGQSSRMSSTNPCQAHKWLQPITVSQSSSQMTDQSQVRSHMTSTNHRQGTAISLHMYSSTGTRIDRGNYVLSSTGTVCFPRKIFTSLVNRVAGLNRFWPDRTFRSCIIVFEMSKSLPM